MDGKAERELRMLADGGWRDIDDQVFVVGSGLMEAYARCFRAGQIVASQETGRVRATEAGLARLAGEVLR